MSIPSIDVRLCLDVSCFESVADFTQPTGVCTPSGSTGGGSSRADLSSDSTSALFQAFTDIACTIPNIQLELILDNEVHPAANTVTSYKAKLTQACLPPDNALPSYYQMAGYSGTQFSDMGNQDSCLSNGFQHCAVQDTTTGLFFGACMPHNCVANDVLNSTAPIWTYLLANIPAWAIIIARGNASNVVVKCGDQSFPFDDGASKTTTVLVITAVFVIAATLFTVAIQKVKKTEATGVASPLVPAGLDSLLRAASLSTTVPRLLGAAQPERIRDESSSQLASLDGIRVLSLSLVVLGHSAFFPLSLTGFANTASVYQNLGKASFQVIPSAEFAVDSFFALSGLLGAYLMTKGLAKAFLKAAEMEGFDDHVTDHKNTLLLPTSLNDEGGLLDFDMGGFEGRAPKRHAVCSMARLRAVTRGIFAAIGAWVYASLHRYLRLLPSVAAMIVIFIYIAPLLGSGPFWRSGWEGTIAMCNDHSWSSLLFLNNFFPGAHDGMFGRQCAGWLWYLAVDYQLHVVAVVPLCAAYALWAPAGWTLLLAALIGTITSSAYQVTDHSLSFLSVNSSPTLIGDGSDDFYDKPVERAPAFLIGLGLGWALLDWERRQKLGAAKRHDVDSDSVEKSTTIDKTIAAATTTTTFNEMIRRVCSSLLPMRTDGQVPDAFACTGLALCLTLLAILFYWPANAYKGELGQINFFPTAPNEFANSAQWSTFRQQAYMIASRPLWSLGLCVLIYFCATKRGGFLAAALGAPFFKPVATVAFGAYLYHPVVLYVLNLGVNSQPHFSNAFFATTYAATCVYACLTAGVMYCLVEAPAAALEKFIIDSVLKAINNHTKKMPTYLGR